MNTVGEVQFAELNANFGAFDDNSVYTRTDYSKAGEEDDTVGVVVDRTAAHGAEKNPFVIRNTTDWDAFVAASLSGNPLNKCVFVLGADLDFNGGEISTATFLQSGGRFYGRGYAVKNGRITGYGALIKETVGDVIISDFVTEDIVIEAGAESIASNVSQCGTIVGAAKADGGGFIRLLNVQASGGSIKFGGAAKDFYGGGLIGLTGSVNSTLGDGVVYKCGFNGSITGSGTADSAGSFGGIIGRISQSGSVTIDSCYFNGSLTSTEGTAVSRKAGGIVGVVGIGGDMTIKNCFTSGNIELKGTYPWSGGVVGLYNKEGVYATKNLTVEHCYSYMGVKWNGQGTTGNACSFRYYEPAGATVDLKQENITDCHYSGPYANVFASANQSAGEVSKSTKDANETVLKTNAIAGLGDAFNVDNVSQNDSVSYPVFSSKIANGYTIKYYQKLDGIESELTDLGGLATYKSGTADLILPKVSAKPSGKALTFSSWTNDASGKWSADSFTTLPRDYYGDLKLYAVWDIDDLSVALTADKDKGEYGNGGVKLSVSFTSSFGQSEFTALYSWKEDNKNLAVTTATYDTENIGEHAYEAKVRFQISANPLIRSEKTVSKTVTVDKGTPALSPVFKGDPYIGMTVGEMTFTSTSAQNGSKKDVIGAYKWKAGLQKLIKGENDVVVVFTPNDSTHYETVEQTLKITAVPVMLTFDTSEALGGKIESELEYGRNYTAKQIRGLFDTEFSAHADYVQATLGRKPVFDFMQDIESATESKTIVVTFVEEKYSVVYRLGYDDLSTTVENVGYNNLLTEPEAPVRRGYRFAGWYKDETFADGTKWDFAADKVQGATTLYAKWTEQTFTLQDLEISGEYKKKYTALDAFDPKNMVVKAVFLNDLAETVKETLKSEDYGWTYAKNPETEMTDDKFHFLRPYITISFTYGDVTKEKKLTLTVEKKEADLSGVVFADQTVKVDNKPHTIVITGQLPIELSEIVTYVYTKGGESVEEAVQPGTYTVTAKFTSNDPDYYAKDKTATLTIERSGIDVTVTWDETPLTYNGKIQHPTATISDEDGKPILGLKLKYAEDAETSVDAGSYRCSVTVETAGFNIVSGESAEYTIKKAKLATPTFSGSVTYDGTEQRAADHLSGFDAETMEAVSGGTGIDAKSYTVTIALKSEAQNNYEWQSTSAASVTASWNIAKAHLTAIWDTDEFLADESAHAPTVVGFSGLYGDDGSKIEVVYGGDYDGIIEVGAYEITAAIQDKADEDACKNYILDGVASWAYVIVPKQGLTIVTVVWDEDSFDFNGGVQHPTATVYDRDGKIVMRNVPVEYEGDYDASKFAGEYTVKVSLGEGYFVKSGATHTYKIAVNADGEGMPDVVPPEEKVFPKWQVAVAASAILIVLCCLVIIFVNGRRRKKYRKETEKLDNSYRLNGIAALPLLLVVSWLGVGANIWTYIAISCAALAVLIIIGAIVSGVRAKKAKKKRRIAETEADVRMREEQEKTEKEERAWREQSEKAEK